MTKALAVALLLSACTEAAAQGFFSIPDSTWWHAVSTCHFQEGSSESQRLANGQKLDSLLHLALSATALPEEAFSTSLPSGILRTISEDKKLIAYTFGVPLYDGGYAYFGQVHAHISGQTTLTPLHATTPWDEFTDGDDTQWPGGFVYQIMARRYRRTTRYIALMASLDRVHAQKKWIEPWVLGRPSKVHSSSEGKTRTIYFGARVFAVKDFAGMHFAQPPKRLILRYAPEVSASIRPGKAAAEILIDEVAPLRHGKPGEFQHYGPTLAVDLLFFDQGKWHLRSNETP